MWGLALLGGPNEGVGGSNGGLGGPNGGLGGPNRGLGASREGGRLIGSRLGREVFSSPTRFLKVNTPAPSPVSGPSPSQGPHIDVLLSPDRPDGSRQINRSCPSLHQTGGEIGLVPDPALTKPGPAGCLTRFSLSNSKFP